MGGICRLPGDKLEESANFEEELRRIVNRKFGNPAPDLHVTHTEKTVETKPSPYYGLNTRYITTICHAEIVGSLQLGEEVEFSRPCGFPSDIRSNIPVYRRQDETSDAYYFYAWLESREMEYFQSDDGREEISVFIEGTGRSDSKASSSPFGGIFSFGLRRK